MIRDRLIDRWRRIVPGHPRIRRTIFYASHAELPDTLPRRQLSLVGGDHRSAKWAVFACPCGTGHRIAVPLSGQRSATWRVTVDATGRPTLWPSIDSHADRRCHFWLRNGKVHWAPSRRAGRRAHETNASKR